MLMMFSLGGHSANSRVRLLEKIQLSFIKAINYKFDSSCHAGFADPTSIVAELSKGSSF